MTDHYELAVYDANFYRWLDKRAARNGALEVQAPASKSVPQDKISLTALLRREFEPKILARLNALGLAT